MKNLRNRIFGCILSLALAFSAFSGTTVFAATTTIDDKTYTTVSSVSELKTALEAGDAYIYLEAGTYEIPSDFVTIPAGTTLLGASADTVIFETAANNTSGQAGLYISKSNVTLENITIQNSSSASYPPLKIEADNVTVTNCVITNNAKKSALVIHGSSGVLIENCTIQNKNTGYWLTNLYAAIQVNGGSSVTIKGGTISTGIKQQPHIIFEYKETSSTDAYEKDNTLIIDTYISYTGGEEDIATIYSAVPADSDRVDTVKVLSADGTTETPLNIQTDDDTAGLGTTGTDWYCYNVSAWTSLAEGYVYANTSDTELLSTVISKLFIL